MSERVLHEWTERGGWIRQISSDGKSERGRKDTGRPDSWTLWMTPIAPETEEIARLASHVTELEAENAKLHDAILDIYNAHQDEALEIRMRECGRWTEIRALVGEANDRAARAEVKL